MFVCSSVFFCTYGISDLLLCKLTFILQKSIVQVVQIYTWVGIPVYDMGIQYRWYHIFNNQTKHNRVKTKIGFFCFISDLSAKWHAIGQAQNEPRPLSFLLSFFLSFFDY